MKQTWLMFNMNPLWSHSGVIAACLLSVMQLLKAYNNNNNDKELKPAKQVGALTL